MEMTPMDCLKKALLDSQEKVRDYQQYSHSIKDDTIRDFFSKKAEEEAKQAHHLQEMIASYKDKHDSGCGCGRAH